MVMDQGFQVEGYQVIKSKGFQVEGYQVLKLATLPPPPSETRC